MNLLTEIKTRLLAAMVAAQDMKVSSVAPGAPMLPSTLM